MEPATDPAAVHTEKESSSPLSDQDSSPLSEQDFKRQTCHYPSLAKCINTEENFFTVRWFSSLKARVILWMQDRIARIEKELIDLDRVVNGTERSFGSEQFPPLTEGCSQGKCPREAGKILGDDRWTEKGRTGDSRVLSAILARAELLDKLEGLLKSYDDVVTSYRNDKNKRPRIHASVRNYIHGPREAWVSQSELHGLVLNKRRAIEKAVRDRDSTKVDLGFLMSMLSGDVNGGWNTGCFNQGNSNPHFGDNMSGTRLPAKKLAFFYYLSMVAVPCVGMLLSGMSFPGGMRTVMGVISTSAAVANVPLHMRSDYNRLRWGVLAFCVVSYGSFLTFLWLSLKGIRRPAYLFFTFLSGSGFIGSALVADKVEDTVNAILTFAPLVATLSAGLLYMPFRYGFGIGANSVEDVEMQPQHNR